MAPEAAQPASSAARTVTAAILLFARTISDHIYTLGDAEGELLIGYSLIFLQVRKDQGGIPPLRIPGGQSADLQAGPLGGNDEKVHVGLGLPRRELQPDRAFDGARGEVGD